MRKRNLGVSANWYDPEIGDEWVITASTTPVRPATHWDPAEGGEMEDVEFTHQLENGTDEQLDESEFLARFGQKELDRAMDNLGQAACDAEYDCDEDDDFDRYDPDEDRSADSFDVVDHDGF